MRPQSSNASGSSRGRLSLILHLSSRKSSRGATNDAGSQSPPCSPISSIYPFYSSSNHSAGGYSTTSLRSALLPPSIYMNSSDTDCTDAVPPTENNLDAKEKAMLLKKARKLSKVFGEIPVLHSVADVPPPPAPPAARHKRSASLASLSSASSGSRSARRRPSQTDISTQSDVPSLPLPQITEARLSLINAMENENESQYSLPLAPSSRTNPSTSSLTSSSRHTTEQAKPSITLTAHHSSPSLPSPSASRRRSIDALPALEPQVDDAPPKPNQVKRSRSMFTHKKGGPGARPAMSQESIDFRTRYNDTFGADSDSAMTLRQKSLNVQRARKMAKVFGQDPPSDLIHIADESRSSLNRLSTASEEPESSPATPTLPAFTQKQPTSQSQRDTSEDVNDPTFTSDFRDRRRRAEKLSRFFGVAYQNIEYVPPPPVMPRLERTDSDVHVDVRMSGGRFWGFDHGGKTKEADMNDVMDKLRGLKAS